MTWMGVSRLASSSSSRAEASEGVHKVILYRNGQFSLFSPYIEDRLNDRRS